jgi:hypothetical protein
MRIIHLAELDDFFGTRRRVILHDAQRRTHAQRAIKDINTKNDWVPFAETSNGFQTAGPNSHGSCIATFRFDYLCVVRRKCVKQVVDDVRYGKNTF